MKGMQKLQPQMNQIKEQYKNDRRKQSQEVMQLYKANKVSPVSGCWPMLVQIPVFFAFFKVLNTAIELRHAPFILWINDLSAPDRLPIGIQIPWVGDGIPILTLLMGASMYFQQKLTPMVGDPVQVKLMKFMPVVFTFFFINFPAGLVLYWFVQNILTIIQQFFILRKK